MVTNTKIVLSAKELELVCNTDWILTKHIIIKKVYDLFGEVLPSMETILKNNQPCLPKEVFINSAKISKGENYKLLPYVMLDYPRYFSKNATVAIRTFFWWGNFFSISLQLSGSFKTQQLTTIKNNFEKLQQNDYYLCIDDNPWQHHFEKENYVAVNAMTRNEFESILPGKPFVKIAKKIALTQWEEAPAFIVSD
jgi:hypothetical protein